jgi:hypothetical protein
LDWPDYVKANKPYPVFIVAAEGGGSYAAIYTNAVLSKLQAIEPRFAEHVFALSAVSGGAVGGASFVAGLSHLPPRARPGECKAPALAGSAQPSASEAQLLNLSGAFVRADYLSPMIGAALFPDFIQRFNPVAVADLDRSRWFEYALEQTWQSRSVAALGARPARNPFADDFFTHWTPAAGHPALVLNVVDTAGRPMILSPFAPLPARGGDRIGVGVGQLHEYSVRTFLEFSRLDRGKSIRLSTAVGLSTRFPFIFSPATIPLSRGEVQFVDGGYYDNTGLNAAALIYTHLTEPTSKSFAAKLPSGFNIYLISIGSFDSLTDTGEQSGLSDLLLPISTLNNTRGARTTNTRAVLRAVGIQHLDFILASDNQRFPLGLALSGGKADNIVSRVGAPGKCSDAYRGKVVNPSFEVKLPADEAGVIAYNSCNLQAIADILSRQ